MTPIKLSIPLQLKAVLVLIAVFSFAISYNNLHAMAIEMGIPYYLAWFFPLCVDLFLIACSIFILYAEEKCPEEAREGWAFLGVYTILSIWYNVLHSPPEFWYQVGFAICPISLCVSLHLFIKVVKHERKEPIEPSIEPVEPTEEPSTELNEVQLYFIQHPEASINQARKDLKMSWKKVKEMQQPVDLSTPQIFPQLSHIHSLRSEPV